MCFLLPNKQQEQFCCNCHRCIAVCPVKLCNDGSGDFVTLNPDLCIGCGSCVAIDPDTFEFGGDGFAEAKKQEIESWEPEIVDLLVKKYIELINNKKPIDFEKLPDLRVYWKIRKIFSKEEVDNWGSLDYEWAIYNLQEDLKEKDELDDRNLEKRKAWMNLDLYNHLHKKEQEKQQEEQENKLLIQKLMEQQGIDPNKFEIEMVEEEDIPTVIEEDK